MNHRQHFESTISAPLLDEIRFDSRVDHRADHTVDRNQYHESSETRFFPRILAIKLQNKKNSFEQISRDLNGNEVDERVEHFLKDIREFIHSANHACESIGDHHNNNRHNRDRLALAVCSQTECVPNFLEYDECDSSRAENLQSINTSTECCRQELAPISDSTDATSHEELCSADNEKIVTTYL